jgi:hypothetical protein
MTIAALCGAACYDPAEPLPDAVRDAVGDYDLVAAFTTGGDSLPADRTGALMVPTGANCSLPGSEFLLRSIGLGGYLTLSAVDRAAAGTMTVFGVQCNDSAYVGMIGLTGEYVLQERYLTLTSIFGGPFGGGVHTGEFDADTHQILFTYPGNGLLIVAIFSGTEQLIALESARWSRVSR